MVLLQDAASLPRKFRNKSQGTKCYGFFCFFFAFLIVLIKYMRLVGWTWCIVYMKEGIYVWRLDGSGCVDDVGDEYDSRFLI